MLWLDTQEKEKQELNVKIGIANLDDSQGIYNALKQNLIEINDFDSIPQDQRIYLETHGFLRKEVEIDFYVNLISDPNNQIYVAKIHNTEIIGFASIYKNQYNIKDFRTTLENVYINEKKVEDLLLLEKQKFIYLDQISILPEFQRKGVGTALLNKILENVREPIVAFIVELPLTNKASIYWHEANGFKLEASCDGKYKSKKFQWGIYINWNNLSS